MAVKVLKAVARGGKTEWAVVQSRMLARGLEKSPYVLLPSKTQVDDFRKRLAEQGGSIGVYLGTFRELASEILDLSGKNLMVISETAQLHLLDSVLEKLHLVYYQEIKTKPGFARTVLAIVRELEAGMIDPSDFMNAVREMAQGQRLLELALIYQEYRNVILANNWMDPAGMVWKAVDILRDQPEICPKWDSLIVDGFDDLSPVQLELIICLSHLLPDVTVTITGASEGTARPIVHKRFNYLLEELTKKAEVEYISDQDVKNRSGVDLFDRLETIIFSLSLDETLKVGEKIKMVAVPDREGEVRAAFRWIKKLINEGKVQQGQAALIMRSLEPYRKMISKISREYHLPVYILGGLPLEENPAIAAILKLLDLAGSGSSGLAWQDVVSLWKSPYFDWSVLSPEGDQENNRYSALREAKQLADIARWGSVIQGVDQWKEAFLRLIAIPEGEDSHTYRSSVPEHLPEGVNAQKLLRKFEKFISLISPPEDGLTAVDYLSWVENLLGDFNFEEDRIRGLNLYQMAAEGGMELFLRDREALRKVTDLFREHIWSDQVFGSSRTTFINFLGGLKADIKGQSFHVNQDNDNLIICADCTEVRGISYSAVAIIGLAEGEFPGTIKEDPFLRNEDRVSLHQLFGFQLRSSTESAEAEFFYEAITRASELLFITRPRIADNGAPWQPSPYWEEILRATDITPELRTSRNVPALIDCASRSELFEVISSADKENKKKLLSEAKVEYPDYYKRVILAQRVISARTGTYAIGDQRFNGNLEHLRSDLQTRYPEEHVWSASRLENYQTCPFDFFVGNLLGLEKQEPPQEGLDSRQLGNIYHQIMEDLYSEVGGDYDIQELLALVPEISQKVFLEAPSREGFRTTAWWEHSQQEILTNIKRSLVSLEGMDSNFRFFRAEQKFGIRSDSAPHLEISVEGKATYKLRGLIDRVDLDDQGNLRIIDYKTSSSFGFDNQAVRDGKKLQLPLYALAAQEGLQLGNVQEGFYFHLRSAQASSFKMSSFWNNGERGSQVAIKNAILKGWQAVSSIQSGLFSPQPPENGCPAYCPATDFCWLYQRKVW